MASSSVSASCKTIHTDPDKGPVQQLFVLVFWHEDTKLFDIDVTDCLSAWSAADCTTRRNEANVGPEQAWQRTKEALLWWAWELGLYQGKEVMALQPPLEQQQDGAAAIRKIMAHMMTSYSILKTAVNDSKKAQQLLERSLAAKDAMLKQKVQAGQEQERVLFTKFAMLLNKKTERIQLLTDKVQEQEQQLEQLRGAEEHDTDDEAKTMDIYTAETQSEDDDEQQLAEQLLQQHQQQLAQDIKPAAALLPLVKDEPASVTLGAPQHQDSAAAAAGGGSAAATPGLQQHGADLDGATQPLDAAELAALEPLQQQKIQLQQRQLQQAEVTTGAPAADVAAAHEGAAAAGIAGIDWEAIRRQQQGQQGTNVLLVDNPAAHKSKAIKRRR